MLKSPTLPLPNLALSPVESATHPLLIPTEQLNGVYNPGSTARFDRLNPILATLIPILSWVNRLSTYTGPSHTQLEQAILQGLTHLPRQLVERGIGKETIDATLTVVVCWSLDTLGQYKATPLSKQLHNWLSAQNSRFYKADGDAMLAVIRFCRHEPSLHCHLLELVYWCYSMGYQGQYRHTAHAKFHLSQIQKKLYQAIQTHQKETDSSVFSHANTLIERWAQPAKQATIGLLFAGCLMTNLLLYAASSTTIDLITQSLANQFS